MSPIPLRDVAEALGFSTVMIARAGRDGLVELKPIGRGKALGMEPAELERVECELRCKDCGEPTLGKTGFCQAHRGKGNAGKSIAAGTRAPTSECRISGAERRRRAVAMETASRARWADPVSRSRMVKAQQTTRRRQLELQKAEVGEGVLETSEVAAKVGRSRATIAELRQRHALSADAPIWVSPTWTVGLAGRPADLWTPERIQDLERWLAHHPDGRLQRFAGGEGSIDVRNRRRVVGKKEAVQFYAGWRHPDLDREVAMAMVSPTVRDRRRVLRYRAGDRRTHRKEQLHNDWRRRFYEKRSVPSEWSDFQLCEWVADDHIRKHPDCWSKYEQHPEGGLRPEDRRRAG